MTKINPTVPVEVTDKELSYLNSLTGFPSYRFPHLQAKLSAAAKAMRLAKREARRAKPEAEPAAQSTIEFRIANTGATHVFSERFLTPEAAYDRIAEYAARGEQVGFLSVFTITAPKHHYFADGL